MSDFAKEWLPYMGAVTDDERGLRVVLPVIGNSRQEAQAKVTLAVNYIERGVPAPGSLGIHTALVAIRDGGDANEAFGLKLPRGSQPSPRSFWIAIDTTIEHRLNPLKLWKDAYGATATAWSEDKHDNIKAAREKYADKANALIQIWIRWAREIDRIEQRSDAEILAAYLHGVRSIAACYLKKEI
jgi:hypothetical protein